MYSTRSLYNAARRQDHFVRIVDHTQCDLVVANNANEVYYHGQSLKNYDAVIPRIGHTATSYGSAIIRQFESMNVFSTLSSEPLLRARDKLSCLQILSAHGVPLPKTLYINNQMFLKSLCDMITDFPKIVKMLSGTHGIGVIKADDQNILEAIMETMTGVGQKVLLQEFIKEASGVDIRAFVVNGRVVASMMRQAQKGEFRSNLHRGAKAMKIILTPEEEETAIKATEVMGLKVAGVDMLRSDQGPLVLEVNASPGLEGIEKSTGINVAHEIILYIEEVIKDSKRLPVI